MWGKRKTIALPVEVKAGIAPLYNSMAISKKIRKQPSSRHSNTTFEYICKGCSILPQGQVFNYVHSSTVSHTKTWKQPKCPLAKEWIRKMWCIYTAEKKNDILKFVGK